MRAYLNMMLPITILAASATSHGDASTEPPTVNVEHEVTQEISALMSDDRIQRLLQRIETMTPGLRKDLIELTQIPAPPFGEEKRAARFAEMLREAGLRTAHLSRRRPGPFAGLLVGRAGRRRLRPGLPAAGDQPDPRGSAGARRTGVDRMGHRQ